MVVFLLHLLQTHYLHPVSDGERDVLTTRLLAHISTGL